MPRRGSDLIMLTAVCILHLLPIATRGDETDDLKDQGAASVVPPILAAYDRPAAETEIEKLARLLAVSSENAVSVLDALAAEQSVEAASVSAELLYAIAAQIGGRQLTDEAHWRQFAEKGAVLLEHDDPFVSGIAAWALIAVRDANQDRPSERETPDWVAKNLALSPETSLESEFVLQALGLGTHRTTRNLSRSAHDIVRRGAIGVLRSVNRRR